MKIEIPSDKLAYWKECAENGVRIIEQRRVNLVEAHDRKIKNRWWLRRWFGPSDWDESDRKWAGMYEFDVYDICENFLIMIGTGSPSIYLNETEVMALRRWETQ